ncbi:unnamed protein product [Dibothriocephalus latus]|uniref:Uncharacterized protein n=1 Tax=Dibothriocephalus latus TaxID=60516 RepID=A0A3P7LUF9_DIBLA|nr:unnamed protein product [Dibothriocephalus latus]
MMSPGFMAPPEKKPEKHGFFMELYEDPFKWPVVRRLKPPVLSKSTWKLLLRGDDQSVPVILWDGSIVRTHKPQTSPHTTDSEPKDYTVSSTFLKGTQSANPHNDYCQHFVDTGERPQNFIRDTGLKNRFEEYPKLRELIHLKDELIQARATPPMYLRADLLNFDLRELDSVFDVILIEPPLEEYNKSAGMLGVRSWSWLEVSFALTRQILLPFCPTYFACCCSFSFVSCYLSFTSPYFFSYHSYFITNIYTTLFFFFVFFLLHFFFFPSLLFFLIYSFSLIILLFPFSFRSSSSSLHSHVASDS